MTTEAQVSANRLNAQKSTGPRTVEGKAAVALNAVKHGLRAQTVVLPGEEPDEYERYCQRMLKDLEPEDDQDREQAERIVGLSWQLRRAGRYETAVFNALYEKQATEMAAETDGQDVSDRVLGQMLVADFSGPRVLERVQLYEGRIERRLWRAWDEWDKLCARGRVSDTRESGSVKRTGAVPGSSTPDGVTTNPPGRAAGQTKPSGAEAKPVVNKQSQSQPPVVGGLNIDWTNKANFGEPINVLSYLADHKPVPARRAM